VKFNLFNKNWVKFLNLVFQKEDSFLYELQNFDDVFIFAFLLFEVKLISRLILFSIVQLF